MFLIFNNGAGAVSATSGAVTRGWTVQYSKPTTVCRSCISYIRTCNKRLDCPDGSDELFCTGCSKTQADDNWGQ